MRKHHVFVVFTVFAFLALWAFISMKDEGQSSPAAEVTASTDSEYEAFAAPAGYRDTAVLQSNSQSGKVPALEERRSMTSNARLRAIELAGKVPEDANETDWALAQKASWWGKPLNPTNFWKGRVVWLDASALREANRHGRAYPPMPYADPSLLDYPEDDHIRWDSYQVEDKTCILAGHQRRGHFGIGLTEHIHSRPRIWKDTSSRSQNGYCWSVTALGRIGTKENRIRKHKSKKRNPCSSRLP